MQVARFLVAGLALAGCAANEPVVRVLGGELAVGAFVPTEAYQALLSGALEEAAGRYREAAAQYERVIAFDPESAEAWARLATVRCRVGQVEGGRAAADRARERDPRSASAEEAGATCASSDAERERALLAAAAREPKDESVALALAQRQGATGDARAARARIASFLLARPAGAGLALLLAEMALRDGDLDAASAFATQALAQSSRVAAATSRVALGVATRDLARGRRAAGALVDVRPVGADGHGRVASTLGEPLVLRLAVDDALLTGDASRAVARADRGAISLGEVAGRALLLGARGPLVEILPLLRASAPRDAALVDLCLLGGRGPAGTNARDGASPSIDSPEASPVPDALVLALREALEARLEPAEAARAIAALPIGPLDARDRLLVEAEARSRGGARAVSEGPASTRMRVR